MAGYSLVLYTREGCGLCEEMMEALVQLRQDLRFELDVVDVDSSNEYLARYGDLVPVLTLGDQEIARYHLDEVRLRSTLSALWPLSADRP